MNLWRLKGPEVDMRRFLATTSNYYISQRCIRCHEEPSESSKCPAEGCMSGMYCSDRCREQDRARHAELCGPMGMGGDFAWQKRPSPRHSLVFYLPPDEAKPRPIWLQCENDPTCGTLTFKFDQESVLRWASERPDKKLEAWANPLGGQHGVYTLLQGHGLLLFGIRQVDGNKVDDVNRSLSALDPTGIMACEFGPVFFVRYYVINEDMAFLCFGDVSPRDLQHGIDNLFMSAANVTIPDPSRHRYRTLPAFKINHLGSPWVKAAGITKGVQAVRARLVGNATQQHLLCLPMKIGLTWMVRQTPRPDGVAMADAPLFSVPEVWNWVILPLDQVSEADRTNPKALRALGGIVRRLPVFRSFILYDAHGAKLDEHHLAAVANYFADRLTGKGPDVTTATSRQDFEAFWKEYQATHEGARDVKSPYDLKPEDDHLDLPGVGQTHPVDRQQMASLGMDC